MIQVDIYYFILDFYDLCKTRKFILILFFVIFEGC